MTSYPAIAECRERIDVRAEAIESGAIASRLLIDDIMRDALDEAERIITTYRTPARVLLCWIEMNPGRSVTQEQLADEVGIPVRRVGRELRRLRQEANACS